MFTKQFHLDSHPFEEYISHKHILRDERFIQATNRLDFFKQSGQVALLTGPTGVGKSLLLDCFLETLPPHRYQTLRPPISSVESPAMFRMIVTGLGEPPSVGKDRLFRQIINKAHTSGRTILIVIDDAHLLGEKTFVDLRLLLSARTKNTQAIKLLLCGQPDLSKQLTRSSLADLLNRVNVRSSLRGLNRDQTINYINHRLKCSGGSEELFDEQAKTLIHEHTGGVPRGINNLATTCLIHATSKEIKQITTAMVLEAAGELRLI